MESFAHVWTRPGLLVQEEFWDLLGGKGTYEDLLNVLEEVKKEISPLIEEVMNNKFWLFSDDY